MNKEEFKSYMKELNINLTDHELKRLDIYYQFLKEYNDHTNLTSIIEEEKVYLKHFYDSLTIVNTINLNNVNSVLDIGTGAGFPGIVIKIFFPNLEMTLIDSNNKKTKFLSQLVEKLELTKVTIINDRSENYIVKKRESFDLVVSRAVADLKVLSELALPFVKNKGFFISYKGESELELKDAEYAIQTLGGKIVSLKSLILPIEQSKRTLVKIEKIKETPKEYPRVFDKILKKPLKINKK